MIDILWPLLAIVALCVVRVNASVAVLAVGLAAAYVSFPAATQMKLIGQTVLSSFGYEFFGAALLLVLGAALQGVGAVQTFPETLPENGQANRRAAWYNGGPTGLPVPLSVPLIAVCLLTETSIGRTAQMAILPTVVISLLYVGAAIALMTTGAPTQLRTAASGERVVLIVFRCLIPILALPLMLGLVAVGLATPNEAAALVAVPLVVFACVVAAVTGGGWRRLGAGVRDGVGGVAELVLLLIGLVLLLRGLALSGGFAKLQGSLSGVLTGVAPTLFLICAAVLLLGMVVGPLTAGATAVVYLTSTVQALGINPMVFAMLLVLVSEAVRVGPQLWSPGFLRQPREDGSAGPGSWPYYLIVLVVLAGSIVLANTLLAFAGGG